MSARAGGVRPWIVQRLSAAYLVAVIVWFLLVLVFDGPSNYSDWHNWFAGSIWNTAVILFWLSVFVHAWVGVRDVIMDYVRIDSLRFILLSLFGFYIIALISWMLRIMILAMGS